MENPYLKYYAIQAGTGIPGYHGVRYQKGHGFFGRLLKGNVVPVLKYLGGKALNTGMSIAKDVMSGEDWKEAAKNRLKSAGTDIAKRALIKAEDILQEGKT